MSTSPDLVSIIMPAYNSARYIAASISSVQAQTWSNWELIIVDDCSKDGTSDIITSFQAQDSRIRIYKNQQNSGTAKSRNLGVSLAAGNWIAFLDSDDCWAPSKLALQLDFAHKNSGSFIFTASAFIDESGNPLAYTLSVPSKINYRELLKQNIISCSSVLIKKEILRPYPMKSGDLHEDFALWLQILRDCQGYAYGLNQPLLIYRVSGESKSGNKLKAARMTYRVYRSVGLPVPLSLYYWGWYTVRSLKKYGRLRAVFGQKPQ